MLRHRDRQSGTFSSVGRVSTRLLLEDKKSDQVVSAVVAVFCPFRWKFLLSKEVVVVAFVQRFKKSHSRMP